MEAIETGKPSCVPMMPPAIADAVVQVKKKVRTLGKDEENKFARYRYVSVDKFYEEIGQLMAENGLFVMIDETAVSAEKRETQTDQGAVKASVWLTTTYELFLFHQSGIGYGPIHRTIMVQATGAQAFGSGMSYVEKYFLRSLFKVPTGDQDADADEKEEIPPRGRLVGKPPVRPAQPAAAKPNGTAPHSDHPRRAEALQAYKKLSAALDRIGTTPQTIEFLDKYGHAVFPDLDLIGEVNPDTHANLKKRFAGLGIDIDAERARLRQREPGDEAFATEAEAARAALQ